MLLKQDRTPRPFSTFDVLDPQFRTSRHDQLAFFGKLHRRPSLKPSSDRTVRGQTPDQTMGIPSEHSSSSGSVLRMNCPSPKSLPLPGPHLKHQPSIRCLSRPPSERGPLPNNLDSSRGKRQQGPEPERRATSRCRKALCCQLAGHPLRHSGKSIAYQGPNNLDWIPWT
jgi:hypothetical protein